MPMNLFDNLFLGPVKQTLEIKFLHFQSTVSPWVTLVKEWKKNQRKSLHAFLQHHHLWACSNKNKVFYVVLESTTLKWRSHAFRDWMQAIQNILGQNLTAHGQNTSCITDLVWNWVWSHKNTVLEGPVHKFPFCLLLRCFDKIGLALGSME